MGEDQPWTECSVSDTVSQESIQHVMAAGGSGGALAVVVLVE